jgi:hypothetical protein
MSRSCFSLGIRGLRLQARGQEAEVICEYDGTFMQNVYKIGRNFALTGVSWPLLISPPQLNRMLLR